MSRCVIYKITHPKQSGAYYGKTLREFSDRKQEHQNDLRDGTHDNKKLQSIANQYGENGWKLFKFAIVQQCPTDCSNELLQQQELKWIAKGGTWNSRPNQKQAQRILDRQKTRSTKTTKNDPAWSIEVLKWLLIWALMGAIAFRLNGWNQVAGFWVGVVGYGSFLTWGR